MSLDPERGGPAESVPALARAQAELGHETRVLTPARGDWHEALEGADLVHQHGVWELKLARLDWELIRRGIPYCVSLRGTLDRWSRGQKWLKKRVAWGLYQRRLLMQAAAIHALTEEEVDEAREWLPHRRFIVAPNAVQLPEILPEAKEVQELLPEEKRGEGPLVLFLARLHHKKGLAYLPAIMEMVANDIPSVRLVIAGWARPDQQPHVDAMRAEFERRGLRDRVIETGMLKDRQKWAALRAADVMILPSHEEGMPMAVLEALAAGLPVVVSPGCRMGIVGERGAGLVMPLRAEKFAEGILSILQERARRCAMGEAARRLAAEEFTWESTARRMIQGYEGAVGRRR